MAREGCPVHEWDTLGGRAWQVAAVKKKSSPSSLRPSSRSSASVQARCCVVLRRWDHRQDCRRIEIGLARAGGPFGDTTRQIEAVQQLGKGAATRLAHCFIGRRVGRAHLRQRDLGANESAVIKPKRWVVYLLIHDGRIASIERRTLVQRVEKSLGRPSWCKQTRVRPDRIDSCFAAQSSPAQITIGQERP